ncbi:MAG: ABC transporter ATP-binding protein [Planctomycetota bacterium]
MIRATELSKLYENHLAVSGLSFQLDPGDICGLVGPNGAGKTTTMRCLAGLIPATDGELVVAGRRVGRQDLELKQLVAYVPDDPPLFDDLSVGQHLEFVGRLYGVAEYATRAAELLTQFELTDKRDCGATTLSRGMRQKLAICCAYLFRPQVLLLDEPLTGLDPPGIRALLGSVRDYARTGATVIISSHLLAMIDDICTHLLVMKRGTGKYFGSAADLRERFPQARTLEEAYFAATDGRQPSPEEAGSSTSSLPSIALAANASATTELLT